MGNYTIVELQAACATAILAGQMMRDANSHEAYVAARFAEALAATFVCEVVGDICNQPYGGFTAVRV